MKSKNYDLLCECRVEKHKYSSEDMFEATYIYCY